MTQKSRGVYELREVLIALASRGAGAVDMLDALADLSIELACVEPDHAAARLERVCWTVDTALKEIASPLAGRDRPIQSLVANVSVSAPDEHGNLMLSFNSLNGSVRYAARLPTTEALKHAGSIIKAVGQHQAGTC